MVEYNYDDVPEEDDLFGEEDEVHESEEVVAIAEEKVTTAFLIFLLQVKRDLRKGAFDTSDDAIDWLVDLGFSESVASNFVAER